MDGAPAILTTLSALPPLHVPAALASTVEGTAPPMASVKKRNFHSMSSSQPAEAGVQSLLVRQNAFLLFTVTFGKICLINTVIHNFKPTL